MITISYKINSYLSQEETDKSSNMYYMKFTFTGTEYTKNIVFYDSLANFLRY